MADLNTYFVERKDQFLKNTIQRLFRTNIFRNLVDTEAADLSQGRAPTIRTHTHELPTAYPSSLTEVAVSTGTGNPYCAPSSTTIKRGEIQRSWKLYQASFKTDTVCLSDLKRAEQAAEAASAFDRALREYTTVWWSDWFRLQNILQVDNKAVTNGASTITIVDSQEEDFTEVTAIPTHDVNWDHLKQVYWELCRSGIADEMAVGQDSKGRPILPLVAGPGIIGRLFSDQLVKEEVKFFDPKSNLAVLGYGGAVNGFLPVVDLFPIRFGDNNGIASAAELTIAKTLYPTTNANATAGRKSIFNTNYRTIARGGRAEFEVVTIGGRNVYKAQFEPTEPSAFAGMNFQPQNYVGEFKWINNPTFGGDNDRGNLGYYLADIRVGAKPLNPDLGYAIVTKATDI